MKHYYTYVNGNFLPRFLALHASIQRFQPDSLLWVLTLDHEVEEALACLNLKSVRIFPIEELVRREPALAQARAERSKVEFYVTCSPACLYHVLKDLPEDACLTKLDTDCFFLADPGPIHELEEKANIAITPHRFPEQLQHLERVGKFNAGWVTIKNNPVGRRCAENWKNQCLEWCHEKLGGRGFGDQKYIDEWPGNYPGVLSLEHPGVNAALWNCGGLAVRLENTCATLNGHPIILFHFSGLTAISARVYEVNWSQYGVKPNRILLRGVFLPYLVEVERARKLLNRPIAWLNFRADPADQIRRIGAWKIFTRCLRGKYVYV